MSETHSAFIFIVSNQDNKQLLANGQVDLENRIIKKSFIIVRKKRDEMREIFESRC